MGAIDKLKCGGKVRKFNGGGKVTPSDSTSTSTSARGVSAPMYRKITPVTFEQQLKRKNVFPKGTGELSADEINAAIMKAYNIKEGFAAPYRAVADKKGNVSYEKDFGRDVTDIYDPSTEKVVETINLPREGFNNGGGVFGQSEYAIDLPDMNSGMSTERSGNFNEGLKNVGSAAGNLSSGYHAGKAVSAENDGDKAYSATMGAVSKMGPVGGVIGAVTAVGDAIGDPIRKKSEKMNRKGEYEDKEKALRNATIGSFTNPLKSGMASLNDPNATTKEKVLSFIGGPGGQKMRLDRKEKEAKREIADIYQQHAKDYAESQSFAEGGKIKGKGTGKSDSINMSAEDGSFIVPVENAKYAQQIGKELLGWKDGETASKNPGKTKIKVSNGEVYFNPEEVGVLKYHGIDLNELAPNADDDKKFSNGGGVLGSEFRSDKKYSSYRYKDEDGKVLYQKPGSEQWKPVTNKQAVNQYYNKYLNVKDAPPKEKEFQYEEVSDKTPMATNVSSPALDSISLNTSPQQAASDEIEEKNRDFLSRDKDGRSVLDYVPELASSIQMIAGAKGLMEAGKAPDLSVSESLKKLSAETRRLSNFGYEPAVLNALDAQIENVRRDVSKAVTEGGGSPMEQMAKLQSILSTTIDKKAGLAFENAKEKARKYADVLRIDSAKAGQEFDINKINLADYYRNQEVFAEMLSSGISNVIGARQLKSEQDALADIKERGKFTL